MESVQWICVFLFSFANIIMAQDLVPGSANNFGNSAQPISFQPMSFSPMSFAAPSSGATAPASSETNESIGSSSSAIDDCGSTRCPAPSAAQTPRGTTSQRGSGPSVPLAGTSNSPTGGFGDQIRKTIQNQLNLQFGQALGQNQGRSDS